MQSLSCFLVVHTWSMGDTLFRLFLLALLPPLMSPKLTERSECKFVGRINPGEYVKIIEENFGIAYEPGYVKTRNFQLIYLHQSYATIHWRIR